ncbi:MAG: Glu-tRNA(Gln) amidotransferase subunit GatE [Candidatus Marsarchaeota archaeon]|nr:Glu-tRNA(Gln) amidotransferase subunit GatE [Candidatus Marsarchaeota archaeon]
MDYNKNNNKIDNINNTNKQDIEDSDYYKKIGFRCGLEIHQRLATSEKLFCHCTTSNPSDSIIGKVTRYQRAVAGELGNVDRSAEFEELKNRRFLYNVHDKLTCLVDIDEEPPHEMNIEALKVTLEISQAFNMKIIDELQPMRKEVVDGSDPSAFQRTTLVALDGKLKVSTQSIGITSIFLEEESSAIVSENENEIVYDPSRLGIPLIEIDTDPDIKTPNAAKEIALAIGNILRVSGKVQRGIGTIRQDVNVSIAEGSRVEMKGFQELDTMDTFIKNEILRQQKLLEIKDELKARNAKVYEAKDLTKLFKNTKVKIILDQLSKNGIVMGFKLSGFKNLLGKEVNPNRRLGTEISDYVKMAKINGLIHSDENLSAYGFDDNELFTIKKELEIDDKNDSFILIAGSKNNVAKASMLAVERARQALIGVPLETRGVANTELCTTKFLRPLPSGSRMYPETDAKPIIITKEMLDEAARNAPDIEKMKERLYKELSNKNIADQLLTSNKLVLYLNIIKESKADSDFVANILMQKFVELKRGGFDVDNINIINIIDLFKIYKKDEITKQAVEELLKILSKRKESIDISKLIKENKLERIKSKELDNLIEKVSKEINSKDIEKLRSIIMSKYRLNIAGDELNIKLKSIKK